MATKARTNVTDTKLTDRKADIEARGSRAVAERQAKAQADAEATPEQ